MTRHLLILLLIAATLLSGCRETSSYEEIAQEPHRIHLIWSKAYPSDSEKKSLAGLHWALSFIGATLPKDSPGIIQSDSLWVLDADAIGLSMEARFQLLQLHSCSAKYHHGSSFRSLPPRQDPQARSVS